MKHDESNLNHDPNRNGNRNLDNEQHNEQPESSEAMSRAIQERMNSRAWNDRMAESVLARVHDQRSTRPKRFRAYLLTAAASLLLAVVAYGTYDFMQPVAEDTTTASILLADEPTTEDDALDDVIDVVAIFD